nr:cupin domain-containing protein [uncultured Eubacterium sp.]
MEVRPISILNSNLSENVEYDNPDFPAYIRKEQLASYPDFREISHWHDDFEFILILDGQMTFDVNGQKISLHTGEGIFVNSRCFHYGYSDTHTDCTFICILLSPSLLSTNTYFVGNSLKPLMQNIHFSYQKLSSAIKWQNSVLRDLKTICENNIDKLEPFIIFEKPTTF